MAERDDMHEAVSEALRTFAVEMEQYIHAAGAAAAIHRTDLTALSHAMDASRGTGRLTPGELATRMGLSPSATTSMLDRLEAAGHVLRTRDSSDRRQVTITVTEHAQQTGYQIFAPLAQAFDQVMSGYPTGELATVLTFLEQIAAATQSARPRPEQS
ncbi:MAG TPA: MarR family transcriptional regulator [Propionibacteriaceae bacterium]|jgi:DNA-binding MarR family transcriptional regulator